MGIRRFGSAYVPMDEALAFTALDFSGRPFLVYEADMPQARMGAYDACLTEEFMRALAMNSGLTLHMRAQDGRNAHHITEALFKSLGLAMKDAVKMEGTGVTSTKEFCEDESLYSHFGLRRWKSEKRHQCHALSGI